MKTKMFKQPGSLNYMAENFLSSGGEMEIFRDTDKKSPHFGKWVLTKGSTFHDCDTYINDLAERNNLSIEHEGLLSACVTELENLKRHDVYCTLDTPFTEESPAGSYVKYDDMLEIINRFKTTKGN